jgi:GMP synthase (glutamine-hydrolysing)
MQTLFIIKIGSTFPSIARRFGDFETWTQAALGPLDAATCILDVENGDGLPSARQCAGVVITGSHAMVTDEPPWSLRLEKWIPSLLEARIPVFGICYGHQLLARAAGGRVGFHRQGKEIGTVSVRLGAECGDDAIFGSLPESFPVHVTHSQTVLRLPPGAACLAANRHEPHHAIRLGDCAWGVQFHPEYDANIMRAYIEEQADELESEGRDISRILRTVRETPVAAQILENFVRFIEGRRT